MKKRTGIYIAIIINVIIILGIIGFLTTAFVMGGKVKVNIFNLGMGEYKIQKEKEYEINEIQNLEIDFLSDSIYIEESDNQKLKIVQKSRYSLAEDERFKEEQQEQTLTIKGAKNIYLSFFSFGKLDSDIYVYLPKNYTKNLNVKTSSGRIEIGTQLQLENTQIKQISGNINIEKKVNAKEFSISNSSGRIEIQGELETEKLEIKQTSGNLAINNAVKANEINISNSSGRVEIKEKIEAEKLNIKEISGNVKVDKTMTAKVIEIKSSSGRIELNEINGNYCKITTTSGNIEMKKIDSNEKFEMESFSGRIQVEELIGGGEIKTTSGNIKASSFLLKTQTNMQSSSGSIMVLLKEDSNCIINTKSTSGRIHTPQEDSIFGKEQYQKFNVKTTSGNITIE